MSQNNRGMTLSETLTYCGLFFLLTSLLVFTVSSSGAWKAGFGESSQLLRETTIGLNELFEELLLCPADQVVIGTDPVALSLALPVRRGQVWVHDGSGNPAWKGRAVYALDSEKHQLKRYVLLDAEGGAPQADTLARSPEQKVVAKNIVDFALHQQSDGAVLIKLTALKGKTKRIIELKGHPRN